MVRRIDALQELGRRTPVHHLCEEPVGFGVGVADVQRLVDLVDAHGAALGEQAEALPRPVVLPHESDESADDERDHDERAEADQEVGRSEVVVGGHDGDRAGEHRRGEEDETTRVHARVLRGDPFRQMPDRRVERGRGERCVRDRVQRVDPRVPRLVEADSDVPGQVGDEDEAHAGGQEPERGTPAAGREREPSDAGEEEPVAEWVPGEDGAVDRRHAGVLLRGDEGHPDDDHSRGGEHAAVEHAVGDVFATPGPTDQ